jgi:hypothetical protein
MARKMKSLSPQLQQETERIESLVEQLQSGDTTVETELVQCCMSLVDARLRLMSGYPKVQNMREDLQSIGYLAIVETIRDLQNGYQVRSNVVGLFSIRIRYAIINALRVQTAYDETHVSLGSMLKSDVGIPNETDETCKKQEYLSPPTLDVILARDDCSFEETDCLDFLFACCTSEDERKLIELRLQGYTIREIEEETKFSRAAIDRMLLRIQKRHEKKQAELDD